MQTLPTPAHQPAPLPGRVAPGTCACGCGQRVRGLRRRASNEVADRMRRDLLLVAGGLADGTLDDPASAEALLAEGAALLAQLTARVHGQLPRADLDRTAVRGWMDRVAPQRTQATLGARRLGFLGSVRCVMELTYGGVRAPGVVTEVRDTGTSVNTEYGIRLTVQVLPEGATPFAVQRKALVPRTALPRVGDAVEVAYDPADPDDFVWRVVPGTGPAPAPMPGDDRVATLQALAELHAAGVLTDDELAAEKARVLGR